MISRPATLTGKRKRSGPPRGPPVLWWRSWLGTSTSSPVRFTLPTSNGNMPRNGPNNNTFQMQPALFMHSRRCTMRWCPIALRRVLPLTAAWLLTDLQLPFPMPLSHWHSAAKPVRLCRKPNIWASAVPTNTLVNDVYMPQVRAAVAMMEHRPERVSGLLASAGSYMPVSKAPQLLGRASLEMGQWQQAVTDLQPGVRYRGLALQEGPVGTAQAPDYALCLLGTPFLAVRGLRGC